MKKRQENKKAIVLAAFGTTYPEALGSILGIQKAVGQAFPQVPVVLAFTSHMIRSRWHARAEDIIFWQEHPEVPHELAVVRSPLAALTAMQNQGYRTILVQPLHVVAGEEFHDLKATIENLRAIETVKHRWRPFDTLALGRPLLGSNGPEHPYLQDIETVARELQPDVDLARKEQRALIYVGHGNPCYCTGAYWDLMDVMEQMYPDLPVLIGCVEGQPSFDFVCRRMRHLNSQKALIKPLMIVAGDHAQNDMAGDDPESLKSLLETDGVSVKILLQGLGQCEQVACQFIRHIQETALKHSIDLCEMCEASSSGAEQSMSSEEIEQESFRRIEAEVPKPLPFPDNEWPVVRRMIHTTADFDLLKTIVFHPKAIDQAIEILQRGGHIHTDTEMARAGINKSLLERLGCQIFCRIHDPEVIRVAKEKQSTRAATFVRLFSEELNGQICVIGNAPTALLELMRCIQEQKCLPGLVIGMPVGFVNAAESKALLQDQHEIPFILIKGRKGGSTLAAACMNALLRMALASRDASQ